MPEHDPRIPELPHPREALKAHGLSARRGWGQNFLVSTETLDRIVEVAAVGPQDPVLEIGTGLGRLTARLAARARSVVSVEIDRGLHGIARGTLGAFENVTLLLGDFLASKHRISPNVTQAAGRACSRCGAPLKVVSNLPYGISSPAIVCMLEWLVPVGEMYLMLQKEVAGRLTAAAGTGEYGPLTVFARYWAEVEELFRLPRSAFWPAPEVSSALVRIAKRPGRQTDEEYAAFSEMVARLFTQRRKTLGRTLREGWGEERGRAALAELGVGATARIAELTPAQLRALSSALRPINGA
jgi:16S rRNA (adenine1518-N6/adenine1519-N6)-dimethyltransferase